MDSRAILVLYVILFSLQYVWESFLNLINQSHVRKNSVHPPPWTEGIMDRETYGKSVDYTLTRSRFSFVSNTAGSLFLLAIVLTGSLGKLDIALFSLGLDIYTGGVVFFFITAAIFSIISLPFSIYSQFVIEERFGFNKMTLKLFTLDILKGILISVLLLTPLLYVLFLFMDRTGGLWWIYAFLAFSLFQLFISVIYPSVIAPIFNRFTPLEKEGLKEKIESLAVDLDFRTKGIFVMDGSKRTKHSNAYFTGLGKTKRIVLFDTLIEQMDEDEVLAVLAHEIAHEKKKHIRKRLILNLAASFIGFWILSLLLPYIPFFQAFGFSGTSYHAAIVLISFCAGPFTFFLQPLFALWSRKHEYEADRFAVEALGSSSGLKGALIRLNRNSLANLTPHPVFSFYYYSHPTLPERIAAMEKTGALQGGTK
jgi:STE24 endopeptidase